MEEKARTVYIIRKTSFSNDGNVKEGTNRGCVLSVKVVGFRIERNEEMISPTGRPLPLSVRPNTFSLPVFDV